MYICYLLREENVIFFNILFLSNSLIYTLNKRKKECIYFNIREVSVIKASIRCSHELSSFSRDIV